jgi:hypothetical protein
MQRAFFVIPAKAGIQEIDTIQKCNILSLTSIILEPFVPFVLFVSFVVKMFS